MSNDRKQGLYPKETIAGLLNLSERRVEQLAKKKIIPKAGRGVFDLSPTVTAYVRYLQGLCGGSEKREQSELDRRLQEAKVLERESKARQAKYRADELERNLEDRRLSSEIAGRLREKLTESYESRLVDEVVSVVSEVIASP